MKVTPLLRVTAIFLVVGQTRFAERSCGADPSLQALQQEFKHYSGADLVFHRDDLPPGRYHDVLKPLSESQQTTAAAICVEEARMYPPGYFGEVGLKAVGVFEACASTTTSDRTRPYDSQLGGYRYFGIYNGTNAIAASFYSDGQLSLTFHHEIFHHIDSTVNGETGSWNLSTDDAFYQAAISGLRPYSAPPIAGADLTALRERCIGYTLKDAVSEYAAKNSREDQAETARHLMSMLPSSLAQAIDKPELPGSQRILHVLREYEQSVPDGPGFDWFVDVALQRVRHDMPPQSTEELLNRLRSFADGGDSGYAGVTHNPDGARDALKAIIRLKSKSVTLTQAEEILQLATQITGALLRQRIRPDATHTQFDIWGQEDADGVNLTLRHDIAMFSGDAKRLKLIAEVLELGSDATTAMLTDAHLSNLQLLACYYLFIKSNWSMTQGTTQVFELARGAVLESLPSGNAAIVHQLRSTELDKLAEMSPEAMRP